MRFYRLYFTFLVFIFFQYLNAQTPLVPFESNWKYMDQGVEPLTQNLEKWFSLNYSDYSWQEGLAQLGYEDGDESTVLDNNATTCYFRHTFNISNADDYQQLLLKVLFDDGAVVYVNGEEVWRINMPAGNITYDSFASSTSDENEVRSTSLANILVDGTNVIAVEVHQKNTSSSDLSFDLELSPISVDLERGPYLQKGSSNRMAVRWRTNIPIICTIDYGTSINN